MAEKRMISKVISISKKFNISINDHFSRLLYLLLIPHSDDFGRLSGDPYKVKALILPMMSDVTWEQVEESLAKLHNSKLIIWYESDEEKYIQIINFEEHQQGLHKRTRSKFPDAPRVSQKFPEIPSEGKGIELNRTEEKGREEEGKGKEDEMPPPDSNPHKDRILKLINECEIKEFNLYDLDVIYSYIGVVDVEVIEAAIKKGQKKESIKYSIRTLQGMVKDGITKKEQVIPKPEVGEYDTKKHEGQLQSGSAQTENKSITGGAIGWLPSKAKSDAANVVQLHQVSG